METTLRIECGCFSSFQWHKNVTVSRNVPRAISCYYSNHTIFGTKIFQFRNLAGFKICCLHAIACYLSRGASKTSTPTALWFPTSAYAIQEDMKVSKSLICKHKSCRACFTSVPFYSSDLQQDYDSTQTQQTVREHLDHRLVFSLIAI